MMNNHNNFVFYKLLYIIYIFSISINFILYYQCLFMKIYETYAIRENGNTNTLIFLKSY